MKRTLFTTAGLALFAASGLANAASWSVFVEPGVYGRVVIGGYAEPPVVYAPQPIMAVDNGYGQVVEEVVDPAYATDQPPVYLWVPEYQRLHWAQYCRDYGAVGVPVYFVDDGWYRANVMRRNWTPEQRSWSQQQWLEQDRIARDRFERQRFEQQRYEQQQRWNAQRDWNAQQQQQGRWTHEHGRGRPDGQSDISWGSARGYVPGLQNQVSRPPSGGGQWQGSTGQWQQGGNGGRGNAVPGGNGSNAVNGGNAGQWQGSGGQWQQGGNGGRGNGVPGGNGGNAGQWQGSGGQWQQGGNAGHAIGVPSGGGGNAGNGGNAGQQPPAASQPHGWGGNPSQNVGDRRGNDRGQDRGDRDERRGQPDRHGAFEHGRSGNRDR